MTEKEFYSLLLEMVKRGNSSTEDEDFRTPESIYSIV